MRGAAHRVHLLTVLDHTTRYLVRASAGHRAHQGPAKPGLADNSLGPDRRLRRRPWGSPWTRSDCHTDHITYRRGRRRIYRVPGERQPTQPAETVQGPSPASRSRSPTPPPASRGHGRIEKRTLKGAHRDRTRQPGCAAQAIQITHPTPRRITPKPGNKEHLAHRDRPPPSSLTLPADQATPGRTPPRGSDRIGSSRTGCTGSVTSPRGEDPPPGPHQPSNQATHHNTHDFAMTLPQSS